MKHFILLGVTILLSISSINAQEYRHEIRIGHIFPSLFSIDPVSGTLPSIHYRYHQARVSYRIGLSYSPNTQSGNFDGTIGTERVSNFKMLGIGAQFNLRKEDQTRIFRPYFYADLRLGAIQSEQSDWLTIGLYKNISQQSKFIGMVVGPGLSVGYRRLSISYEAGLFLDNFSRDIQETLHFPIFAELNPKQENAWAIYAHILNLVSIDFHF